MSLQVVGASHIGSYHQIEGSGNQDNFIVGTNPSINLQYGIVCDGCGSSLYPQACVNFTRFLARKILQQALLGIPDFNQFANFLWDNSLAFINSQIEITLGKEATQAEVEDYVLNYWLCTTLMFIQLGETTAIFYRGDGVIRINRWVLNIDQDNRPWYLAYFAIPWRASAGIETPGFNSIIRPTSTIESLFLCTDEWRNHIPSLRTLEQHSENSEVLQMKLNSIGFDLDNGFGDDATVVGLTRG